jgi:hypothetical protein
VKWIRRCSGCKHLYMPHYSGTAKVAVFYLNEEGVTAVEPLYGHPECLFRTAKNIAGAAKGRT